MQGKVTQVSWEDGNEPDKWMKDGREKCWNGTQESIKSAREVTSEMVEKCANLHIRIGVAYIKEINVRVLNGSLSSGRLRTAAKDD